MILFSKVVRSSDVGMIFSRLWVLAKLFLGNSMKQRFFDSSTLISFMMSSLSKVILAIALSLENPSIRLIFISVICKDNTSKGKKAELVPPFSDLINHLNIMLLCSKA